LVFKILIDTCVWLDLAKDAQQRPLLSALEELVQERRVVLVVPTIVREEFERHRERIVKESARSMTGVLKRVRDVVERLGDAGKKNVVLQQLQDVGHMIPLLGEAAIDSIGRIASLLDGGEILPITDAVKLAAADRAIFGRAPFHRQKNSIADAIIMETYAALMAAKSELVIADFKQLSACGRPRQRSITGDIRRFKESTPIPRPFQAEVRSVAILNALEEPDAIRSMAFQSA
jgi:hypothetical protein